MSSPAFLSSASLLAFFSGLRLRLRLRERDRLTLRDRLRLRSRRLLLSLLLPLLALFSPKLRLASCGVWSTP